MTDSYKRSIKQMNLEDKKAVTEDTNDEEFWDDTAAAEQFSDEDNEELNLNVSELKEQLSKQEIIAKEQTDKALRAMSEAENVRKRSQREIENTRKYGIEKLVKELLPVLDGMEQALSAIHSEQNETSSEGIALTHKMLLDALKKFNVIQIDPTGEAFDPVRHEAMSVQPNSDVKPGTVLTVFQKGYLLYDRVLRPARVVVASEPDVNA